MYKLWIYVVIFLLSEEWFLTQGTTNSSIIVNTTTSPFKVYANRKEVFNLGSDAKLICSNTQTNAICVLWKIKLKHKACEIYFNHKGYTNDSCNDGKLIQNSAGRSFLHIPNISVGDVGAYRCQAVYTGGRESNQIAVGVTAPPFVSAWLEQRGNKTVAVCRAERGIPAANIRWSLTGNDSMKQQNDRDGVVTVESQLEVPEDIDRKNLTCIVRHQLWEQDKTFTPRFRVSMLWIRVAVVFIVIILGLLIFALKKWRCQQ